MDVVSSAVAVTVKRTETQPRKELGIWKLEIQISSGVQGIKGT